MRLPRKLPLLFIPVQVSTYIPFMLQALRVVMLKKLKGAIRVLSAFGEMAGVVLLVLAVYLLVLFSV